MNLSTISQIDPKDEDRATINSQSPANSSTSIFTSQELTAEDHREEPDVPMLSTPKTRAGSLALYIRGINVIVMQDLNERAQRVEVASLCLSDLIVMTVSSLRSLTLRVFVGDFQLDNQMFDHGGFDFPVVLINQNPYTVRGPQFSVSPGTQKISINDIESGSLMVVDCAWEVDEQIYGT